MARPRTRIVSIGDTFGRLVILKELPNDGDNRAYYCRCECGNELALRLGALWSGNTKSCGCYRSDYLKESRTTHGMSDTPLYAVWSQMRQRCENENDTGYKDYGARGISVTVEWGESFQTFYDWALSNGYKKGLTIERIDYNGGYNPENCTWIPRSEQSSNRRSNRAIKFNGETKSLSQWARDLNMNREALKYRLDAKWDVEKAFTQPIRKTKKQGVN